jgi:hypothetical protein
MTQKSVAADLAYVGPCPCCCHRLEARVPSNSQGRRIIRRLKRAARERNWENAEARK